MTGVQPSRFESPDLSEQESDAQFLQPSYLVGPLDNLAGGTMTRYSTQSLIILTMR